MTSIRQPNSIVCSLVRGFSIVVLMLSIVYSIHRPLRVATQIWLVLWPVIFHSPSGSYLYRPSTDPYPVCVRQVPSATAVHQRTVTEAPVAAGCLSVPPAVPSVRRPPPSRPGLSPGGDLSVPPAVPSVRRPPPSRPGLSPAGDLGAPDWARRPPHGVPLGSAAAAAAVVTTLAPAPTPAQSLALTSAPAPATAPAPAPAPAPSARRPAVAPRWVERAVLPAAGVARRTPQHTETAAQTSESLMPPTGQWEEFTRLNAEKDSISDILIFACR